MLIKLRKSKAKQNFKKNRYNTIFFQNLVRLKTVNLDKLLRQTIWVIGVTLTLDGVQRSRNLVLSSLGKVITN